MSTSYKKYFSSPFLFIAIACFVIAIIIFATSRTITLQKTLGVTTKNPSTQVVRSGSTTPTPSTTKQQLNNETIVSITPTTQPVSQQTTTQQTAQPTQTPSATNTPAPQQNNQVNLSINGSSVGSVTIASGANQCDVLSQALSQGKIQSLNMRYDNSLGTYGVYQINGTGKENAIWWTYKVNGQSPGQGCSYIKANNGDNVEWNYIGN